MTHNDKFPLSNYSPPFQCYLVESKFSLHNARHEPSVSVGRLGGDALSNRSTADQSHHGLRLVPSITLF